MSVCALAHIDVEPEMPPWWGNPDKGTAANPLVFKFIFVKFPNTEDGQDIIGADVYDALDGFIGLMQEQSNENMVIDYSMLFDPRDSTETDMWLAGLDSGEYGDPATVPTNLEHCWPPSGDFRHVGALESEIFHTIQAVFDTTYGVNNWTSPLSDTDMVIFVFKPATPSGNPLGLDIGGLNAVHVRPDCPELADILNGVPSTAGGNRVLGYAVNWWSLADKKAITIELVHELGHILSWHHPVESELDLTPDEACHFGSYNVMRAVAPNIRYGFIDHWSRYQHGWCTTSEIVQDVSSFELVDWRVNGDVVKIPILNETYYYNEAGVEYTQYSEEYFLLAYHVGDYPYYEAADEGLYIWHLVDQYVEYLQPEYQILPLMVAVRDLEIATGLYSDPRQPSNPDWVDGVDLLDNWVGRSGYDTYLGANTDLFNSSEVVEFSYKSNPNTNGYSWAVPIATTNKFSLSQDQPNSISVEIVGSTANSVYLDISFAPSQDIVYPNGGESLTTNVPVEIQWETTETIAFPDGIIDLVDIYYSRPAKPDAAIAQDVDATTGSFLWTPDDSHVGDSGKINIVYHNVNDSTHVGEDLSDGFFEVTHVPIAKFTDVSSETGLDYSGSPYSAVSFDQTSDQRKDLLVAVSNGESVPYNGIEVRPSGAPEFQGTSADMTHGIRGCSVADYDNDGDQDLFVAHATAPKLYRNDGANFADVTASLGLANLANESTAACWGDFDRDGWIDLYVVRSEGPAEPPAYLNIYGLQHRLFRNATGEGGGFVDVTANAGLQGFADVGSVSASWADVDQDGDLDLFVANLQEPPVGSNDIRSLLFINQGDGTFLENLLFRFPGDIYFATAHQWADVDNDADLDLVVSTHEYKPEVHLNDGFGGFLADPVVWLDAPEGHNGVQVFDHDLDGRQDVLLVSRDAAKPSRFFSGIGTGAGPVFVEATSHVNLDNPGSAMGSVAADFTGDGDADLFLGKPASPGGGYFYKTDSQAGANSLDQNYVKVRLESPYVGGNNRLGIGSTVTIVAGASSQMQIVDGGSGRGGQNDRDLVFGLGDYADAVTATVRWSTGVSQYVPSLVVSNDVVGETLNTITDASTPTVSSASAAYVLNPVTGFLDWSFVWETDLPCDPALDAIEIDQAGIANPCWADVTVITPTTTNVVHVYEPIPGGGARHELHINGQDCNLGCSFRFSATSGIGPNLGSSAPQTKKIKVCQSQY
jgi:hypothetical protein